MEDVVHHNSAGGYAVLAVQVGISGFLMWYVIRRARYELNKACLPNDSTTDDVHKQLSEQRSLLLFGDGSDRRDEDEEEEVGSCSSSRLPSPSAANSSFMLSHQLEEEMYSHNVSSLEQLQSLQQAKKQGHKRAKSAGAVMYAFERSKEDS